MAITSSSRRPLRVKRRSVVFSGAEVIEYEASMAPAVHYGGAYVHSVDSALECTARGVNCKQELVALYIQELQQSLSEQGFQPIGNDFMELQLQRQAVQLLLLWATSATIHVNADIDILHLATLQRAQLEQKQLDGFVDESYAFGRRFMSVETFVNTLSRTELVKEAKNRHIELPKLNKQQKVAVKAMDRELVGLHGTAQGRLLRLLTLRQLMMEAEARGIPGLGDKAKDKKGKKSKRAWFDILRPVMILEVRASKIQDLEEEMLRKKVAMEIELEQERVQQQRVAQLIEVLMQRTVDRNDTCAEPEDDDAIPCQNDNEVCDKKLRSRHKMRTFLAALAKSVYTSREKNVSMMK